MLGKVAVPGRKIRGGREEEKDGRGEKEKGEREEDEEAGEAKS